MKQPKYLTHFHAIEVRYYGPTDNRDERIRIKSLRFRSTIHIKGRHSGNVLSEAVDFLRAKGFDITASAETKDGWILFSHTFHGFKGPADRIEQY